MPFEPINGPQYDSQEFNTGDSRERGDSPKMLVEKMNAMLEELYQGQEDIGDRLVTHDELDARLSQDQRDAINMVEPIATEDATDEGTAIALVNELKSSFNALLAALQLQSGGGGEG